jgi:exopolysaccharide production protein ExoZ
LVSEPSEKVAKTAARIRSLQVGRAFAAILVVLSHNNAEVFGNSKYWPENPLPLIFDLGFAGVAYFFVLSGFIILHVHWEDATKSQGAAAYLWKRFARIFPPYWIVLGAVVAVYFLVPRFGEGFERAPGSLLSSFLLIAGDMHEPGMPLTILVVAWTLYHEILFYLLFASVIIKRRLGIALLSLWFAGSAVMMFMPVRPTLLSFYFAPIHLLFGLGMGAAWLFRKTTVPRPALLVAGGIMLYMGTAAYEMWRPGQIPLPLHHLPYGVGAMMAVLGFAALERSGRFRVAALLAFLGEASYAIYLVHAPAMIFLAKVVSLLPERTYIPPILWYLWFPCAAVVVGAIFHVSVERPLLLQLQKRNRHPRSVPLGTSPAS